MKDPRFSSRQVYSSMNKKSNLRDLFGFSTFQQFPAGFWHSPPAAPPNECKLQSASCKSQQLGHKPGLQRSLGLHCHLTQSDQDHGYHGQTPGSCRQIQRQQEGKPSPQKVQPGIHQCPGCSRPLGSPLAERQRESVYNMLEFEIGNTPCLTAYPLDNTYRVHQKKCNIAISRLNLL